jgi:HPt (histidine-containing phosphotransfer) domain-containing protein
MDDCLKQKMIASGVDADGAIARFMGNEALFEKFFYRFAEDKCFSDLEAAIAADDCDGAFRAAHTLKGVCANLSMTELARLASEQTEYLRAKQMQPAKELMPEICRAYDKIIGLINEKQQ